MRTLSPLILRDPSSDLLPGYVAALSAGWSPNTQRDVTLEELALIEADAVGFLAMLRGEVAGRVRLADGREVARLPGRVLWLWDGEFCGSINFRYVVGTEALPSYVSGHVGFSVVPWKRRRGYATCALAQLLPLAAENGLRHVLAVCDAGNLASRRVIEVNGGRLAAPDPDWAAEPGKLAFWIATIDGASCRNLLDKNCTRSK